MLARADQIVAASQHTTLLSFGCSEAFEILSKNDASSCSKWWPTDSAFVNFTSVNQSATSNVTKKSEGA
jgi:hypothetical protein